LFSRRRGAEGQTGKKEDNKASEIREKHTAFCFSKYWVEHEVKLSNRVNRILPCGHLKVYCAHSRGGPVGKKTAAHKTHPTGGVKFSAGVCDAGQGAGKAGKENN